jgi:hypothetical protein
MFTRLALLLLTFPLVGAAEVNLVRNGGFEAVPGSVLGQALLPAEWSAVAGNTDTYSSDGSYGLLPADFGNFAGLSPYAGLRFVAAAAFGAGSGVRFGQVLAAPLAPNGRYRLSAQLLQAARPDLNHPGG